MTSDVRCDKDIKRRIAIAKKTFMEKKNFTNSKISIETRKRFLKCYIWSVLLYGSERWTISAEMKTNWHHGNVVLQENVKIIMD